MTPMAPRSYAYDSSCTGWCCVRIRRQRRGNATRGVSTRMNWIAAIGRVGRNQVRNAVNATLRRPVSPPSLVSMTVDEDDVLIAREQLRRPRQDSEAVSKYESGFARWNGSRSCFAFMAGRVALSACIYALELEADDEVIIRG